VLKIGAILPYHCEELMTQLFVSQHPLIKHKLSKLRDESTDHRAFRDLVRELAMMLCYEATQDIEITPYQVQTPLAETDGFRAAEIGLVPVLRAGLGMVEGVMEILPSVQVWHIGLYRDEKTMRPVEYYNRLPNTPTIQMCIVLDPMLATGGSASATIDILKRWGVKRIKYMGIIAAPEGVKRLSDAHPDVPIHVAALDSHLNDVGFIVPGLGDAGDRQFGT
jgi:uracil phosphoribosyltransferase